MFVSVRGFSCCPGLPLKHQISLLQNSSWFFLSDFCTQGSQKSFLTIPPKKHADEITPQIWPTTFWKRRGFPSAWSSRSAAILRAPSQHPWMFEKVGGLQSFRSEVWGPLIKGKFKGVPCPQKNGSEEARGGACHPPFFLGEKVFWTENIFLTSRVSS